MQTDKQVGCSEETRAILIDLLQDNSATNIRGAYPGKESNHRTKISCRSDVIVRLRAIADIEDNA